MTSASESSSRPSADDVWRQRAIRPSRTSKANAAGANGRGDEEVADVAAAEVAHRHQHRRRRRRRRCPG
jgi:hypothetical protein